MALTEILLLLVASAVPFCSAAVFSGSLNTGDSFALVGRFAFSLAEGGENNLRNQIDLDLTFPTNYDNFVVGLYFENWENWEQYNAESTCIEKISFATKLVCTTENSDDCPTLPLNVDGSSKMLMPGAFESIGNVNGVNKTTGSTFFSFVNSNEIEWIWVVLANCNPRACSGA